LFLLLTAPTKAMQTEAAAAGFLREQEREEVCALAHASRPFVRELPAEDGNEGKAQALSGTTAWKGARPMLFLFPATTHP
jgi:hypothetical protein